MKNYYHLAQKCAAAFFILFLLSIGSVSAQTGRRSSFERNAPAAPSVSTTLTDSFPDPNGDGKAEAGDTVTYTATVTNNGTTEAANVVYSSAVDSKSALVANSTNVQSNVSGVIRCTFYISGGNGSSYGCSSTGDYAATDSNLNMILGGHNSNVYLAETNVAYNGGAEIFRFDATVQNLVPNALGTLDGATLDAAGIRLFVQNITVNSGSGAVSAVNADGTAQFTLPNQPYYQYNQTLAQNQISGGKTLQFSVPNTVNTFTVDFLISTKVQQLLVINEILANPANYNSNPDATGEWFEIYNAGKFPVDMQNFLINDTSTGGTNGEGCFDGNHCHITPFTVGTSLPVASGAYVVFGKSTDRANNGGVPVDYSYGTAMSFANSSDGLRVRTPASTGALTVDQAYYSIASISAQDGISRELKNPALDNTNIDNSNWGNALPSSVYGSGGRGTPKAQNSTFTPAAPPAPVEQPTRAADALSFNAPTAGETVTANLGTIPAGASVTVTYQVKIANPLPAGTTQISSQGTVSGDNFASVASDDPATAAVNDATATPVASLAPTASTVTISGRVSSGRRGAVGAVVLLTGADGVIRKTLTDVSGNYRFTDVAAGETYILRAAVKRFELAPQVVYVTEDVSGLNFTSQ